MSASQPSDIRTPRMEALARLPVRCLQVFVRDGNHERAGGLPIIQSSGSNHLACRNNARSSC